MAKKYLWKYLSLDKFEWMLSNTALYLPSMKKLQVAMDPIEGATSRRLVKNAINDIQKMINYIPEVGSKWNQRCLNENFKSVISECESFADKLIDTKLNYSYIYSMSYGFKENYALWKIYPTDLLGVVQPNQGIALKIDKNHFSSLFKNKNIEIKNNILNLDIDKTLLENVIYKTKEEIQNIIEDKEKINHKDFSNILKEVLLIKDICYKFAEEKRYIVNLKYDTDAINNYIFEADKSFINIKFNMSELFNPEYLNIIISPFANRSLTGYVKYLLKQQNVKDIDKIVLKSEIAVPD